MCVTDKKDVIVVSIVLPHSNDDNNTDDECLMRAWGDAMNVLGVVDIERSNRSLYMKSS